MGTNAYAPNAKTFVDYKSLVEAVKNDPNGIGYSSLKTATQGGAKLVSIDNIAPNDQSVQNGSYPYARGFISTPIKLKTKRRRWTLLIL